MTIKQRQDFQNVSQQKKIVVFQCPKEKLSGQVRRKIEDERVCASEERLFSDEGKVTEGDDNCLLMLANSAELISESEDSFGIADMNPHDSEVLDSTMEAQQLQENADNVMAADDKNCDKNNQIIPPIAHERNEKDASHQEEKVPRLSHIRRQARLTGQSIMQQGIQEEAPRCLQGSKTARLTEIRRQARLGNHVPLQGDISGCSHGKLLGGITRLSQIRRQARSKHNCSLQEGIGEHMCRQSDCQFHEDHHKEDMAAEQCAKLQSCQVVGASSFENGDKMMGEKGRLRLSQIRRKARMGNADLATQKPAGTQDNSNVCIHFLNLLMQ
ncbi:hypothetical protein CCACVL1_06587 [Corchorus capsularis]|uniref:Uncharacterized protein n=1 Tax=Corchorus capsularis TaxID=210143 RepID=A0A1R3JEH3_COCAP|nr:hypothetical protein CCACVL1_06587 [Corchorus capsularis]